MEKKAGFKKRTVARGLTLLFFLLSPLLVPAEKLFVFYPTTIRPRTLAKQLSEVLPLFKVSVFGRYRDFMERVRQEAPDAIIVKASLVDQFENYTIVFRGTKDGESKESYVLISLAKITEKDDLSKLSIGVVDFLGRQGMSEFVTQMLQQKPKIKRVFKTEDLLPLLTFSLAQGILIPENEIAYFEKLTNQQLQITRLEKAKSGLVVVALRITEKNRFRLSPVKNLPKDVFKLLGVDKWE